MKETGLLSGDRKWLLNHTDFDEAELDRMYNLFRADYPRGGMFRYNCRAEGHLQTTSYEKDRVGFVLD